MTININSNSIVYVLCPAGIKTGGTELSHQLVYLLNKNGIEAYITYTVSERNIRICEEFKQYVEKYMTLKDIKDNNRVFKDVLIHKNGYSFSKLDNLFIEKLIEVKRKIMTEE